MWSFQIKFHKIISFRILSKITGSRKKAVWWMDITKLRNFLVNFWYFFWMIVFKAFSPCKAIFKIDIKSLILPQLMSLWCLYSNVWTGSYLVYVLEEYSSRPEEFFKKGVLQNFGKFTGKHLRQGFFCNNTASWRPVTSLNTESGRGAFLRILRNL